LGAGIPFVERAHEMDLLVTHWEAALAGRPQSVLVTGAPGSGKSRLLAEFDSSLGAVPAEQCPTVLRARFEPSAGGESYHPQPDLLQQLCTLNPNDARLPNGGITLSRLQGPAIRAALTLFLEQAVHRPLLILVDDVQRADADTLRWIAQLNLAGRQTGARASSACRLMILMASRDEAGIDGSTLRVDRSIPLGPLSEVARRDLLEALLPGQGLPLSLIDRVSGASEGNVLYLVDAARSLVDSRQLVQYDGLWQLTRPVDQIDLPPSIAELVMAELDSLPLASRAHQDALHLVDADCELAAQIYAELRVLFDRG
jgi:predicted ATPase